MMRPGQHNNNNKRNRNRNRRHSNQGGGGGGGGGGNGGNRVYDSNGPDVKLRGTAQTIAEKYMQLARDAQSSGDSVMAESCYQHADHYYRIWLAAQPAGQPLQFSRRLAEEEFEDADDDQNDGDGESQDNEGSEAADTGEGGAVAEGQGEPSADGDQPRNNQREFRPYNRDGGNRDNRDNREGGREGGNRNFRQRWPRRNDRFGADGQPLAQGSDQGPEGQEKPERVERTERAERPERPERAERVERTQEEPRESVRAAEVSDSGDNWEAPSFLRRPVPAEMLEVAPVISEDAPPPRRRGRPPKVVAAPVEETPQDE